MTIAELVAKLGLDWKKEDFDKAGEALEKIVKAGKAMVTAFAGSEIFKGMKEISDSAAEAAHHVDVLSERYGVNAEKLQQLGAIAPDLGIEGVGQAMKFLSRNAFEAATKGGEAAESFRQLGVGGLYQANGQLKTADTLLEDVADGMSKIQDPTVRAALAQKVFGREGAQFVNILKDGRKGLEESIKKVNQYGFVLGKQFREQAKETLEAHHAMERAFGGFRNVIAERLLPIFERIYNGVAKIVSWFAEVADKSNIVEVAIGALAAIMLVLAINTAIALLPWILLGAGIALAVLAIEDVITAMKGGKAISSEWLGVLNPLIAGLIAVYKGIKALASGNIFGTGGLADLRDFYEQAKGNLEDIQAKAKAQPSTTAIANRANVTVNNHQTINAHAGQSPEQIADAVNKGSHDAFEKSLHHAFHALTAGVPAGATAGGGGG